MKTYMVREADIYHQAHVHRDRLTSSQHLTPKGEQHAAESATALLDHGVPTGSVILSSEQANGTLTAAILAGVIDTTNVFTTPLLNEAGNHPEVVESLPVFIRHALWGNIQRFRSNQLVVIAGRNLVSKVIGGDATLSAAYAVDAKWHNPSFRPAAALRYAPALLQPPTR